MPLLPVSREHLEALSGATGILQHAIGSRPDPAHGTCTDDVARALRVDLVHRRELGWAAVAGSAARNLSYLAAAFMPSSARFRNFRAIDGAWLDRVFDVHPDVNVLLTTTDATRLPAASYTGEPFTCSKRLLPSGRRTSMSLTTSDKPDMPAMVGSSSLG